MAPEEARRELMELLREHAGSGAGPEAFPLDRAALLLAVDEYPQLDLDAYDEQLDAFALGVAAVTGSAEGLEADPRRRIAALRSVLFEEGGFHGNRDEYYDVRNSYLNEVLDRKLGIPISLAVVMLGVGRRLRWPMVGISFPGHFLVGYRAGGEILPIDAFHGGLILGAADLEERWRAATGEEPPPVTRMLVPAEPAEILVRMLNNIRLVHAHRGQRDLALLAAEKMALVQGAGP